MVELLTSSYAGRIGTIIDQVMGYYKVNWIQEVDGTPLSGVVYWVDKRNVKVLI